MRGLNMEELLRRGREYREAGNIDRACQYLTAASCLGSSDAMVEMADILIGKKVIAQDQDLAMHLLQKAAGAGNPKAYSPLAKAYAYGTCSDIDPEKAGFWAEKAIPAGCDVEEMASLMELLRDTAEYEKTLMDRNLPERSDSVEMHREFDFRLKRYLARHGHPEYLYIAAVMYDDYSVRGVSNGRQEYIHWLLDAAEAGVIPAYLPLSELYKTGELELPADPERVRYWAQKYLDADPEQIEYWKNQTHSPAQDITLAEKNARYEPAVKTPNDRIPFYLESALSNFRRNNIPMAEEFFGKITDLGFGIGAYFTSMMYDYRYQDHTWIDGYDCTGELRKAAALGYPDTCIKVAERYLKGECCPFSPEAAERWAKWSLQRGENQSERAQEILKLIQENRDQPENLRLIQGKKELSQGNTEKAAFHFWKAAKAGHPEGMFHTALAHWNVWITPTSWEMCHNWMLRSAGFGYAPAYDLLAKIYREGMGISMDPDLAAAWERIAEEAGSTNREILIPIPPVNEEYRNLRNYDFSVYMEYLRGLDLMQENAFEQALLKFAPAARKGHAKSYYLMGICCQEIGKEYDKESARRTWNEIVTKDYEAYLFMEAAAVRGSEEALRWLAENDSFYSSWQIFAESIQLKGCEELHSRKVEGIREGSIFRLYRYRSVKETMTDAFKERYRRGNHPDGEYYKSLLEIAIEHGNLDAMCAYAEALNEFPYDVDDPEIVSVDRYMINMESHQMSRKFMEMAAVLGHPYAMYKLAVLSEDPERTKRLFLAAAECGYAPAKTVCEERGYVID